VRLPLRLSLRITPSFWDAVRRKRPLDRAAGTARKEIRMIAPKPVYPSSSQRLIAIFALRDTRASKSLHLQRATIPEDADLELRRLTA